MELAIEILPITINTTKARQLLGVSYNTLLKISEEEGFRKNKEGKGYMWLTVDIKKFIEKTFK